MVMKQLCTVYNTHAILCDLKLCRDLSWGRILHAKGIEGQNVHDLYIPKALIKMYGNCCTMVEARCVFGTIHKPGVISWNLLLMGYVDNGDGHTALDLFHTMKRIGCTYDSATYVAALKACMSAYGKEEGLERGRQIHSMVGSHLDHYVQNTLIDMYSKYGNMVEARRVFDSIQVPNVVSWNTLIMGYANNGHATVALEFFTRMKSGDCSPDSLTYVAVLKACRSLDVNDCLRLGRKIQAEIGHHLNHYVQNTLIDLFSKCGCMEDALHVFSGVRHPNVVTWNALILGYEINGESVAALELFADMKARGCIPNSTTYIAVLKCCTSLAANDNEKNDSLQMGRKIHSEIGCRISDEYVMSTLIDMYAKCGSLAEARFVFDYIQSPSIASWNALIMGYAAYGKGISGLQLFLRMKSCGYAPNSITYVAAIKCCSSFTVEECFERCREIHAEIGVQLDHYVQAALVDIYAKCGNMLDARFVFDSVLKPDVVCWTALIIGYVENGQGMVALQMFLRMKAVGCKPTSVTYMAALKSCGLIGALLLGRKIHLEITDFTSNVVTCLVDLYAKCGSMVEAQEVFDKHSNLRTVSTWTALLAGYGSIGNSSVLHLFDEMQDQGFRPDSITFLCMLLCCSHAGLVEKSREYLNKMVVHYGLNPTVIHYNCVVDILGRANKLDEAITFLRQMPCDPNAATWRALISACLKWKNVEIGTLAFQSLIDMDTEEASAYILASQIRGNGEGHAFYKLAKGETSCPKPGV